MAVRREQNKLPGWVRDEIRVGLQDGVPKGYEEMVGEYFRALAVFPAAEIEGLSDEEYVKSALRAIYAE